MNLEQARAPGYIVHVMNRMRYEWAMSGGADPEIRIHMDWQTSRIAIVFDEPRSLPHTQSTSGSWPDPTVAHGKLARIGLQV